MEATELKAYMRTETGKGPARRLRSRGFIPAVFYGAGTTSMPLSVSAVDLLTLMKAKEENVFIRLMIDAAGQQTEKLAMIKELQKESLSRAFLHADFCEVSMDHKMTFEVPFHFTGTPAGVEDGNELLLLKREVKVSCLPQALPEFIPVDLSTLQVGHALKLKDLAKIEGLALMDPEDTAIAMVAAPRSEAAPEADEGLGEGVKEPEVLKQRGKEEA